MLLYILKSKSDINKFNAIKVREKVGIVFHPEAAYFLSKVNDSAYIYEDLFEKSYLDQLYLDAIDESHCAIGRMDKILEDGNITNVRFKDIDGLDTATIGGTIFYAKLLQDIIERYRPLKIICSKEVDSTLHDKYLYFSSSSICALLEKISIELKIELKIYNVKYIKNIYQFTLFSNLANSLKRYIPKVFLRKFKELLFLRNKKIKTGSIKLSGQANNIIFINNQEPTNTMADVARAIGFNTFEWHVEDRRLYSTTKGFERCPIGWGMVNNYNNKLVDKVLKDVVNCLYIDLIGFNIGFLLKDKIENIVKYKFSAYDAYLKDFNEIINLLNPNLIISLDTLQSPLAFIARSHNLKNIPWLSMFHGPIYSGSKNKLILERLYQADIFCCDGQNMKNIIQQDLDRLEKKKKLFVTGNATYIKDKVDIMTIYSPENDRNKYDILYITTKLNTLNSSYIECHSNNHYMIDSKRIHTILTSLSDKWKIAVKVKPLMRNSGLPELYFYNNNSAIDYYNSFPGVLNLLSKSEIIIIDSVGTTLLQALTLGKKIMFYQRDPNCLMCEEKLSEVVDVYSNIDLMMKDIENILNGKRKRIPPLESKIKEFLMDYSMYEASEDIEASYLSTILALTTNQHDLNLNNK